MKLDTVLAGVMPSLALAGTFVRIACYLVLFAVFGVIFIGFTSLFGGDPFWSGNQQVITSLFGPTQGAGGRAKPLELVPAMTYAPETYERALKQDRKSTRLNSSHRT